MSGEVYVRVHCGTATHSASGALRRVSAGGVMTGLVPESPRLTVSEYYWLRTQVAGSSPLTDTGTMFSMLLT